MGRRGSKRRSGLAPDAVQEAVKVAVQRIDCRGWFAVAPSYQFDNGFQRVGCPLCRENMAELESMRGFDRLGQFGVGWGVHHDWRGSYFRPQAYSDYSDRVRLASLSLDLQYSLIEVNDFPQ